MYLKKLSADQKESEGKKYLSVEETEAFAKERGISFEEACAELCQQGLLEGF